MDLNALKNELVSDPLGRGYAAMGDAQAASDINTKYRTRLRAAMSGDEVFQATVSTEFASVSMTDAKRQMWLAFCARDNIDPRAMNNLAFVRYVFGAGSATEAALSLARTETISRAEELGIGRVKEGHVSTARVYGG